MIGRHVTEGIELHRLTEGEWDPQKFRSVHRKPTGETYWKLAIRCAICQNIIEECLCFKSKEAMETARKQASVSGWTCSTICHFKNMEQEFIDYWSQQFENDQKYHIDEYDCLDGKTREERIQILALWFDDNDLGDEYSMSEDLGSEECPI